MSKANYGIYRGLKKMVIGKHSLFSELLIIFAIFFLLGMFKKPSKTELVMKKKVEKEKLLRTKLKMRARLEKIRRKEFLKKAKKEEKERIKKLKIEEKKKKAKDEYSAVVVGRIKHPLRAVLSSVGLMSDVDKLKETKEVIKKKELERKKEEEEQLKKEKEKLKKEELKRKESLIKQKKEKEDEKEKSRLDEERQSREKRLRRIENFRKTKKKFINMFHSSPSKKVKPKIVKKQIKKTDKSLKETHDFIKDEEKTTKKQSMLFKKIRLLKERKNKKQDIGIKVPEFRGMKKHSLFHSWFKKKPKSLVEEEVIIPMIKHKKSKIHIKKEKPYEAKSTFQEPLSLPEIPEFKQKRKKSLFHSLFKKKHKPVVKEEPKPRVVSKKSKEELKIEEYLSLPEIPDLKDHFRKKPRKKLFHSLFKKKQKKFKSVIKEEPKQEKLKVEFKKEKPIRLLPIKKEPTPSFEIKEVKPEPKPRPKVTADTLIAIAEKAINSGRSRDEIARKMRERGWGDSVIDYVFSKVKISRKEMLSQHLDEINKKLEEL